MHTFLFGCNFMIGLGKPQRRAKFEVLARAVAEIFKGNPKYWGDPLAHGHTHFFFWWNLMIGLGKPQRHAKFEVAGFIRYGNIREFGFKRQIRFLSHPLWELWVTYGLHL